MGEIVRFPFAEHVALPTIAREILDATPTTQDLIELIWQRGLSDITNVRSSRAFLRISSGSDRMSSPSL